MDIEISVLLEIFGDTTLSEEELRGVGALLKRFDLNKGDILLHKGEAVLYTHYVYKGCLRTYFIDGSGKEHTLQFAIEDWWISDYTGFFSGDKAMMTIACIQDTTLYRLSRKDMERLYLAYPALETFFRKKLEKRVVAFHKRTLGNLALTAKDRYVSFIKTYPHIEKKVKNYHIASYLGITTESLSRIRKELAQ